MRALLNRIRLQFNSDMNPELVLSADSININEIHELQKMADRDKQLVADIKPYRASRSLNSNAYLWVMLGKLAEKLHTSKDEVYLLMLERYGQYTHIVVKAEAVDRVIEQWRTVRNLGPIRVNGVLGVQLQCYFGSSTYNTAEMAALIDGVVSECKDVGIETLTPAEIEHMNREWDRREV